VGAHLEPQENEKNPCPHVGNLMGTQWELEGNMLRTQEK